MNELQHIPVTTTAGGFGGGTFLSGFSTCFPSPDDDTKAIGDKIAALPLVEAAALIRYLNSKGIKLDLFR